MTQFHLRFQARVEEVGAARRQVVHWLTEQGVDPAAIADLGLVVAELAANAVNAAAATEPTVAAPDDAKSDSTSDSKSDIDSQTPVVAVAVPDDESSSAWVAVDACVDDEDVVELAVSGPGALLDLAATLDAEADVDAESGRGLAIVRSLTDRVRADRRQGRTTVTVHLGVHRTSPNRNRPQPCDR